MKWISHKIITFTTVFFFTNNIIASILSSFGSIFPDAIEGSSKSPNWQYIHRKTSHWLLGYLIIAIVLWLVPFLAFNVNLFKVSVINSIKFALQFPQYNIIICIIMLIYVIFFITIGAICHIIQDSFSAKIPIIHPNKRTFVIKIGKTGGYIEFFLVTICIVLIGIKLSQTVKTIIFSLK